MLLLFTLMSLAVFVIKPRLKLKRRVISQFQAYIQPQYEICNQRTLLLKSLLAGGN